MTKQIFDKSEMMRTALLALLLVVAVSSTSLLRKSISRRQSEPEPCQAIDGFDCKCSYHRVTCTSDRDLQSTISIVPAARGKYQSVELVINGEREYNIYESTFEPVKQLYAADAENLEFRIKFEKFTGLHLQSPGVFNRVFPDNTPSNTRKHMAVEIYNPVVQPHDNPNLFKNLNVDSLELYVLYPFRGTFQQLFHGANIKFLRLSGGDIVSDLSQSFSGNIGRLEIAKQASSLSVQNFPVYPAHELIINAFYVTDFNSEHPPNYSNLGEIRIFSQERIPANAFRQFPGIHTLSISTEKDIDPHALDGLTNLEKLTVKDTKPPLELLNSVPNVKEFETSIEKLDERAQCQLIEKLANGQVAIQAIPNGRECNCVSAYLDAASGRSPCDAQNCDQSSCAAIKNSFDGSSRTFRAPPAIRRSDGTDALRLREPRVYTAPFQVSRNDQAKLQQAVPQQAPGYGNAGQQQQPGYDQDGQQQQPSVYGQDGRQQQPSGYGQDGQQHGGDQHYQPQPDSVTPAGQSKKSRRTRPRNRVTTPTSDQSQQGYGQDQSQQQPNGQDPSQPQSNGQDQWQPGQAYDPSQQQPGQSYHPHPVLPQGEGDQHTAGHDHSGTGVVAGGDSNNGQDGDGNNDRQDGEGNENRQGEDTNGNRPEGDNANSQSNGEGSENRQGGEGSEHQHSGDGTHEQHSTVDPNQVTEAKVAADGTDVSGPGKKGMNWWLILIIAAAVIGLILAVVIFLFLKKKRGGRGYNPAATTEHGAAAAARA